MDIDGIKTVFNTALPKRPPSGPPTLRAPNKSALFTEKFESLEEIPVKNLTSDCLWQQLG